jgi:cytoskeleton protein RodZ
MSSEAASEPIRGIGARLRAAREKRGLTLLQAAEKLHVDARVLEALEAEDFAALGAAVYVHGHLRRYAELTGESPAELRELYAAGAQVSRPDLTRIPHAETRERSSPLMLPMLLAVIAIALGGLVWWVLKLPGEKSQPVPATLPAPLAGEPLPADDGAAAAPLLPAPPPVAAAAPVAGSTAATPAAGPGQAQLGLRFSAPSWVEISDAHGRRLLSGRIEAGSTRALEGPAPLQVTLGNAPAVTMQLNGRPVALAGMVRRDGSAHLLIDSSGRASLAASRLAHGD